MGEVPEVLFARSGTARPSRTRSWARVRICSFWHRQPRTWIKWDGAHYGAFLRRLARFSRLILMDKRGCGLSDRSASMPTAEEQIEDARAVLDAVGSISATVFGVLDGAGTGLLLALHHPERIAGVVAYAGFARGTWSEDHQIRFPPAVVDTVLSQMQAHDHTASLRVLSPSVADDPEYGRWWVRYLRSSASNAELARWFRHMLELDLRDVLPLVQVPVLVLHRAEVQLPPVSSDRDLAARIPGARIVELPGRDYAYWVGDTEALVAEIEEFLTGRRSEPDPERVLSTVLFTDIVGSTEMATELGDRRWREVLDRHDAIAAREVAAHRGRLVKSTGDGLLATFDGPARAIHCAVDVRDAMREAGVPIRAGVHTGEIELRGSDVGGVAVRLAARVQAKAAPDEVLVSRTVTDFVVGSGLLFEPRGDHELKGLPGTWALFAVVEPELAGASPAG